MALVAFAVFFASGFAALLYQVVWQRVLMAFSGADVYSATLVVAAFMGGLGAGGLVGGHLADRVGRRASLLLFCGAELAVAAFGAVSALLYHGVLYQQFGHLDLPAGVVAVVLFVSLLWPTFFMGASLPLLARALTGGVDAAAPTIGALYGCNTLGAAIGALGATWWLIPLFGLEDSLRVAAAANVGCALVLLPSALRARHLGAGGSVAPAMSVEPEGRGHGLPFWVWAVVYGCSGLIALSFEIAWFRLLGVMMKSTAFTFGTLLALFLSGIGAGAIVGSALAVRLRRPAAAFLLLQAMVGLSAGGLLIWFLARVTATGELGGYFAGYEPLDVRGYAEMIGDIFRNEPANADDPGLFFRLYLGVPALLILPPTFLMGCSFPVLQRLVQTDLTHLGRRTGALLVANIAGSLAGAVLTGWVLLDVLGTADTLRLLVALSVLFACVAVLLPYASGGSRLVRVVSAAPVLCVAPLMMAMPDAAELWSRLHGAPSREMLFAEDGSGLSVIKLRQRDWGARPVVFINGLGQSALPYGDLHTALAAVPAFVHGAPKLAAVIGLGSGDTVHAMAGHPSFERVVSIEIVRSQLETLRGLRRVYDYPGLAALLDHPKVEHVFGDGRTYLRRSREQFDVIEADALRPTSAYAGNLYSVEYFRLLRDRLAPGGLAATWLSSPRVRESFLIAFPHVVELREMLIGSNQPIVIDPAVIGERLTDPRVQAYYARAGIDITPLVMHYIGERRVFDPAYPRESLDNYNTDLDPRDEFDLGLR